MKLLHKIAIGALALVVFSSCEKDIEVTLPSAPQEIVVEAYITDFTPLYNYVILSRTVDYFNPQINLLGVKGAQVFVTEGVANGTDTTWDTANKIQLIEVAPDSVPGVYFNPLLNGRPEHVYKLEVNADGKYVHGVTTIPKKVPLDSLTYDIVINPDNNKDTGKFMTIHFMEPAEKGNNYRVMYNIGSDSTFFGWGSIDNGNSVFNDDVINGVYRHFTYGRNFKFNDTVRYFFSSIDRHSYNFWDSYASARNNGGPFSTPVTVKSNVQGAIGSFTGMAVTYKSIIIKRR